MNGKGKKPVISFSPAIAIAISPQPVSQSSSQPASQPASRANSERSQARVTVLVRRLSEIDFVSFFLFAAIQVRFSQLA